MTKPNEQHWFDLLYMPHNLFEENTYKYILTGTDFAPSIKSPGPLELKIQTKLRLCWEQSIKKVACLSIQGRFNVIMDQSLKTK